jgi:primosomal protein N' (replication factor Y)
VVGARSSLFLPYPNLGLIIVDEAHETSFKQEEGVLYMRARRGGDARQGSNRCPIVLASATPADRDAAQAEIGRYAEPQAAGAPWRRDAAGDQRDRPARGSPPERGRWIAPTLVKAVRRRSSVASSRCCSSTGVAMRR